MARLFGTDGVRGLANEELNPAMLLEIGRAAGFLLGGAGGGRLVMGRDPRHSGDMLEAALVAGLLAVGCSVQNLGVVTTPAVAFASRCYPVAGGVMISASHNPFPYNGVKIFGPDGFKLSDAKEDEIEALVRSCGCGLPVPTGKDIGRVHPRPQVVEEYEEYLAGSSSVPLNGIRVILDCAHGSASGLAYRVFSRLGAEVEEIHACPDGMNINVDSGSTHPDILARTVVERDAALGFAFDGDADRLIAVDERGQLVDGDCILAICGLELARTHQLGTRKIVATVMSNLGLELALRPSGIELVRTQVGDRYVLEAMRGGDHVLGGEQSGHIIFLEHATTGDGILTAVQLASMMVAADRPLSELAQVVEKVPQVLINVTVGDRDGLEDNAPIKEAVARVKARLGERGRVLVRPSGTEPLVRVMVEALDEQEAELVAGELAEVVDQELGRG